MSTWQTLNRGPGSLAEFENSLSHRPLASLYRPKPKLNACRSHTTLAADGGIVTSIAPDGINRDGDGPNWIGMPIWESDPDKDDKRNFIAIMQGVRRDYDLLTNH